MLYYSSKRLLWALYFVHGKSLLRRTNHFFIVNPYRQTRSNLAGLSTTSFLTATTLIYAIGAGITAAAGTRLALQ
jgi:hypothetical protein